MTVAGYGGGVNSTAMCIEWLKRGNPLDRVLFADTGGELPETYAYIEMFSAWLAERGVHPIVTVRDPKRTLEQECLDEETLPSIVVGFKSCSDKFKIRPQNRYMKEYASEEFAAGRQVIRLVGFDAGEPHRVKDYDDARYAVRYPLVESGIDRDGCRAIIREAGLPMPPKSSCFFCPNMRKSEIIQLSVTHPDRFDRAVAMEKNNKKLTSVKGLKRTTSFEEIVAADLAQCDLFVPESEMPCGCID